MKDTNTPRAKQNPGQNESVTGQRLLYISVPTIPLALWMDPIAANILPKAKNYLTL